MNMARDNVPVLLCAGRTPATERGHVASRDVYTHWGQSLTWQQRPQLEGPKRHHRALCMAGFPVGFGRCAALSRRRRPRVDVGCPVSRTHGTDQSRLGPHDQIAFWGFSGPKHLQD